MKITFETKVFKLLKEYPKLLDVLITLSPRYKKLKNPILRRTITRVASLRQASYLGGFTPEKLVNILRAEVGQDPINDDLKVEEITLHLPSWAKNEQSSYMNATEILNEDKNPLQIINKKFKKIKVDETILIESDFIPSPLIDEMRRKKALVVVLNSQKEGWYKTYIKK